MKERNSPNIQSLPPIKHPKKLSIESPIILKKSSKDLTPLRFRDKLFNKTIGFCSTPAIPADDHTYKFTLEQGNNHALVRKVLNSRSNWTEIPAYNTLFHLNWQPISANIKFERLKQSPFKQIVNHFEGQKELSSKLNLLNNLQTYCEENRKFLFDILPTTFVLDLEHLEKFDNEFQDFLNCFQGKSLLFKSTMFNNFSPYKLMTKTFDKKNLLYSQPRNHSTLNLGHNIWILKPADYNRGRGIRLFDSLDGLQRILIDYEKYELENYKVSEKTAFIKKPSMHFTTSPMISTNSKLMSNKKTQNKEDCKKNIFKILGSSKLKTRRFIIQKYIENPFLLNQRKFDIRVWVLLNHEMNLYFFREGYVRTSSEIFDLNVEGLENPFIHLTNNAIQKNSEKYELFEKGNQLSFHSLDKYFRENNLKIRTRKTFVPKIKEIIMLCFKSVEEKLNPNKRKHCFEIFGFDFMIDAKYNLWLLEINTNPCLEESSPLLKQLIPRMLDDAFQLTIDAVFPEKKNRNPEGEKKKEKKKRYFKVNGYHDDENLWELLFNIGK